MGKSNRQYLQMVRFMKIVLAADTAVFLLSLLFAGFGVGWLRVILRFIAVVCSGAGLALLYMNKEMFKARSRWMVVSFAAILICVLVSMICNYPSPYVSPLSKAAKTAVFFANNL